MTYKRSHIRFKSDPNTIAWISTKQYFEPQFVSLVENEAYKGCGLLTNQDTGIKVGDICHVAVGEMAPMKAEVRWVHALALGVFRIGLCYLD